MKPLESTKTSILKPSPQDCLHQFSETCAVMLTVSMTRDINYMNEAMERRMRLITWERGIDKGLQKHYCIKSGALKSLLLFYSEFV